MTEDADAPDPLRDSLEKAVGGQYRIVRLLGRGGMGAVYLAREEALERLVAIKVLTTGRDDESNGRDRFRREARTAASLVHANIVALHGFGEAQGLLYLVMGYVSGESLRDRLKRDRTMPADEARRILADVAEALDYAHRHGVIHRDVKPDNILIDDETGRAFLADFGIARGLGGDDMLTKTGQIIGTPHYMSPEQAAGRAVDGRSDLYSLGAVGFNMLSGRLPIDAATPQEALVKRLTVNATPLLTVAPGVPLELAAAIDRSLARDPGQRFQDARAFRQAVGPSALEEDDLPEPLDTLDGKGPVLLALATGVVLTGSDVYVHLLEHQYRVAREQLQTGDPLPFLVLWALGIVLILQLPILFAATRAAIKRGFTPSQIAGAFLRQPRGWLCFWYPRMFRRKGDIWSRLPRPFRFWRILSTVAAVDLLAFFALLVAMRIAMVTVAESGQLDPFEALEGMGLRPWIVQSVPVTFLLCGITAPFVLFACARLVRSQGFETYDLRRVSRALLIGPTSDRTPWRKPEVARLLLAAQAVEDTDLPKTPTEFVRAISKRASLRPGESQKAAEDAATAARGLATAIAGIDRDIESLAARSQPEDITRLSEQIAALSPYAGADPERAEMRELLQRQLALHERSLARVAELRRRRARLHEGLTALWRGVARSSGSGPEDAALLALIVGLQGLDIAGTEGDVAEHGTRTRA